MEKFQRACCDEQRQIRLNQITSATIALMQDLPFDKITMKKIGEKLSFTRNNLYQYVKSKNEIILLILQQDFIDWYDALMAAYQEKTALSIKKFSQIWTRVARKQTRILHWFPLLGELIERDVTLCKLVPFKKSFFNIITKMKTLVMDVMPEYNAVQAERFLYFQLRILPHLYHVYHESAMQQKAIQAAGYPLPADNFQTAATVELQIYLTGLKAFKA